MKECEHTMHIKSLLTIRERSASVERELVSVERHNIWLKSRKEREFLFVVTQKSLHIIWLPVIYIFCCISPHGKKKIVINIELYLNPERD